jgi:glycosyltransferase involved in cell wall biosynthesis
MSVSGSGSMPLVSVVIPSYQSARHIRTCLQALEEQETSVGYEVVLVDSSSDGTDGIVSAEFPWVRMTHFPDRKTAGQARNVGIRVALGRFILFTDSDCIPCPEWVESMYAAFGRYGALGVGGTMANGTPWSLTGTAGFYLEFFRFLARDREPFPVRFLVGGNSGFRREVFQDTCYSDDSLGEDMVFSWQTSSNGRLISIPLGQIRHLNRTGFRHFLAYQRKIGRACVMYRSVISPGAIRIFRYFPIASLLLPFVMIPWIAGVTLFRGRARDFLSFLFLSPLCFVGSLAWAWGFREAINQNVCRERV